MTFTFRYGATAALSPDSVRLIKTGDVWANGEAMTFNNTLKCYELDIDTTSAALFGGTGFDTDVTYYVRHNDTTDYFDLVMIGDGKTKVELDAHIADTTTHGTTGAVVGISDTQTLTNKTIDGDLNTLLDISFASMKAATAAPAHYVKPDGAVDTALHIDTSSATILTVTAADVAKSADRICKIVAGSVAVATRAGAAAKITGLAAATANGDAVRYDEFHAVDLRVAALETADEFTGSPVCTATITGYDIGKGEDIGLRVQWAMESDAQTAKAKRYEIFWAPGILPVTVAAGAISAADLALLRGNANIFRHDVQKGQPLTWFCELRPGQYSFQVVAFDWVTGQYASAVKTNSAIIGGALRPAGFTQTDDASYLYIPQQIASGRTAPAAATNGAAQAVYAEWLSSDTTPSKKDSFSFKYKADMARMRIGYFAKTASGFAVPRFYICDNAGTELATASGYVTATSFTQGEVQIDLSGLVAETMYELRIAFAAGGSYNAYLRGDWVAEVDRVLKVK